MIHIKKILKKKNFDVKMPITRTQFLKEVWLEMNILVWLIWQWRWLPDKTLD